MKPLPSITINQDGKYTRTDLTAKEVRLINLVRGFMFGGKLTLIVREGQVARYEEAIKYGVFEEEAG